MRVASLSLEDFRSYERRDCLFVPGVTAFVGPNGAGKTNLLEAVHLVARGESSRAGDDAEMVRWGASFARIVVEACYRRDERAGLEVARFAAQVASRTRPG